MHNDFFLNFFAVSILIGALFYLLVSLFIFFGIPEKSKATKVLGLAFLFSGMLALAYVPAYSIYEPWIAYHRWFTVSAALLAHPYYGQMLYYYPTERYARTARIVLGIQLVVAAIVTSAFIYVSLSRPLVYTFAGHLWDIDIDTMSKVVAGAIVLNILHLMIAGVVHLIKRKGERGRLAAIYFSMLFAVMIPTFTNALSRDGLMTRDLHQTILVLMSIAGLFTALMVYLNTTTDKTTFMAKIIGVSLVTFMLLMVLNSFYSFQDKEDAYDSLRVEQTSRLSVERDYPVPDLEYLLTYEIDKGKFEFLRGNGGQISPSDLIGEFTNTSLYERIRAVQGNNWQEQVKSILKDAPAYALGYVKILENGMAGDSSPQGMLKRLDSMSQQIVYRSIKIKEIPDAHFREDVLKYADKLPAELSPFKEAILQVSRKEFANDSDFKKEVLQLFVPFRAHGIRHYRKNSNDTKHFTAFLHFDPASKKIYEAGYSYVEYRSFIHKVGLKLVMILFAGVLLIGVGFRFFFLGTLVRPLESLLAGVRLVNAGDLAVQVKVTIADEIGFLTESFNGMVSSIKTAREKLERYADELEEKVKERTAELSETLRTVQELKHQQDGDYFLTSLLIKPLTRNLTTSQNVHVEFLIEQKKKFEFRKWKEEIGGDFCSAHSIELHGKKYTVFVNADAMGKSMQGAGGALVLGAVFESLMERTRSMPVLKNQSPERWIKNAFQELQNVFESFDGSMLVSMVLGLVDDETGLLYYINVEHPWTVLYRAGKAEFMEKEHMFRKLGVSGVSGQIQVVTVQLEPDDVLIVGSDGRDDLMMGTQASGERIINEDEYLFLSVVEVSQGRLPQIRSHLIEHGSLTDDLSLIRISYRTTQEGKLDHDGRLEKLAEYHERAKQFASGKQFAEAVHVLDEALEMDSKSLKTIRMLVRILLDQKDFEAAFAHAEDYIYLKPLDTDMIYLAAYLCKKLKRPQDAVEFGERVRLRAPRFVRNLINLAEVHRSLRNLNRARKLVGEALRIEPENPRAIRLRDVVTRELALKPEL
ncbi:MAG: SpoIIE family protein phosphatase [Spirochaetia bacterium]|nr:SpoIIE family protein phosphatase [Spirochaetia bacterium]